MTEIDLLIVDDEQNDLDFLSQVFEDENCIIHTALSGEEALHIIDDETIQIVLLDICLPGLNGYEVCKEIRIKHSKNPIQILLLSGFSDDQGFERILEVGADDFINKNTGVLELQARMRAAQIRLTSQTLLLNEKEFYRRGMAEEEKLSSVIRNQNKRLKDANDRIRKLNYELEKANRELEEIATYDALSGLLNRRSMFQRIDVELERANRLKIPLSGIMLDIDHFKLINDNYGHKCGDIVIKNIGEILKNRLRKYDYAGRYGGEEFFFILPNTERQQAHRIAERFRSELEKLVFSCDNKSMQITVSMGIAQYIAIESREEWFMRADNAMYRAKQTGRNRVVSEPV